MFHDFDGNTTILHVCWWIFHHVSRFLMVTPPFFTIFWLLFHHVSRFLMVTPPFFTFFWWIFHHVSWFLMVTPPFFTIFDGYSTMFHDFWWQHQHSSPFLNNFFVPPFFMDSHRITQLQTSPAATFSAGEGTLFVPGVRHFIQLAGGFTWLLLSLR